MKKFIILSGAYGCGKTCLTVNMAVNEARKGKKVFLVDFDLTDYYFASSSFVNYLENLGITVIRPTFSQTTLDLPVLPQNLYSIFTQDSDDVIIDLGGGDDGARFLKPFYREIEQFDYKMYLVVNYYRSYLKSAKAEASLATKIEQGTNLKMYGVINNSNLKEETTAQNVLDTLDYANEIANILNIPLSMTAVSTSVLKDVLGKAPNIYPLNAHLDEDE